MKFDTLLRYTLGRFVFEFHKIRMGDDVIMTTSFNDKNLMIKMKVTLADNEGHRRRSKVTKNELMANMSQTFSLTDIILGTKVQYNKRHQMT